MKSSPAKVIFTAYSPLSLTKFIILKLTKPFSSVVRDLVLPFTVKIICLSFNGPRILDKLAIKVPYSFLNNIKSEAFKIAMCLLIVSVTLTEEGLITLSPS